MPTLSGVIGLGSSLVLKVYFLNPEMAGIESLTPIVGFAVSFPKSRVNPTVTFAVHEQLLSKFNINDDLENENNDED